jgi:hypothetical protein
MLTYNKIHRKSKWAISGTILGSYETYIIFPFLHLQMTSTKSKLKLLQFQIKTN